MIINKINYGQEVTIISYDEEKNQAELKSHVALLTAQEDLRVLLQFRTKYPDLNFCIVEPVRAQSKLVNFQSEKVICNVTTIINENPYIWRDVMILNIRFPVYGSAHLLATNENCKSINRREAYRLYLGYNGTVKVDDVTVKATIVDISEMGVGVIVSELKIEKQQNILVNFREPSNDKEYHLRAYVVRMEETVRGNLRIGCRLLHKSAELRKLIMMKQKERLAKDKEIKNPKEEEIEPLAQDLLD